MRLLPAFRESLDLRANDGEGRKTGGPGKGRPPVLLVQLRRPLVAGGDDRSDQAGRGGGQHIVAVPFAPFVAARRGAQVIAAIVDPLAAAPVVRGHAMARAPVGVTALP